MDSNRESWNRDSDDYQRRHGELLAEKPLAWGAWRIAEADLNVLGKVEGLDVLELGCGAAQWTIALLQSGARAVGIDLSERQLEHAANAARRSGIATPLVHGTAEALPFRDESFDILFCDHGAMTFSPPELTVPEASRILRPGGVFAFCMSSPIRDICWDPETELTAPRLCMDYFGMHALEDDNETNYQLPYGAWIRLFRENGLQVEDLIELQPPEGATTTYSDYVQLDWARRWPAENIWKLRKETSEKDESVWLRGYR
jgi:SAM-dependent methyltransferase